MVNGSSSPWCKVQYGVSQGTVHGPLVFLIYANDLPMNFNSPTELFADDSVLYRSINSFEDHILLQKDLETLSRWAEDWQIRFEPSKCYTLVSTLKKQPSVFSYSMLGSNLTSSSRNCNELRFKANRVLGGICLDVLDRLRSMRTYAWLDPS